MEAQEQVARALPTGPTHDTRRLWGAVVGLLVVHSVLAWLARAPGIETGQDDATYVLLSQSLAQGEYRDLFLVGAPHHRTYPPGYPALLMLWGGVTGPSFDALVTLSIVCSAAALALTFSMIRRLFSTGTALLCLAVLALNPYLVEAAGRVASEAPYALFSVLALWAFTLSGARWRSVALAGVAAIAATLTRSVGATLLIALGAYWVLQRRSVWTTTLAIAAAITVGLWSLRTDAGLLSSSYLADATFSASGGAPHSLAQELVYRVAHNVPLYLGLTLPIILPLPTIRGPMVDNVLGVVLSTGGLLAGIAVLARRWRPAVLYLLCYGALLALWPWHVLRFMVPLLYVLVPAVLIGSGWLTKRLGPTWESRTILALGLVLGINGAIRTARMVAMRGRCERGTTLPSPTCVPPKDASFYAALDYVGKHTKPDAVFVAAKSAALFYYTGRRSLAFDDALKTDSTPFAQSLARRGAQYVLLTTLHASEPRLGDLLTADCRALSLVASFPSSTYLFGMHSGAGRSDDAACRALAHYRRANLGQPYDWVPPWRR